MAQLKKTYSELGIKKPVIFRKELSIKEVNEMLKESSGLYFIGFDKLQIPRYGMVSVSSFLRRKLPPDSQFTIHLMFAKMSSIFNQIIPPGFAMEIVNFKNFFIHKNIRSI